MSENVYASASVLYELFVHKGFAAAGVKLAVLGVKRSGEEFATIDLETELAKDIDRIRFSKNVTLYENNDASTVDDYLKSAEKFSFRDVKASKVVVRVAKLEDITKEYVSEFVDN